MSANDILDVLNVQREDLQPPKKKKKSNNDAVSQRQSGMARELYNLIGPNTPPVSLSNASYNSGIKSKLDLKPSPWTRVSFTPNSEKSNGDLKLYHWVRGSKELLEQDPANKTYFFDKFSIKLDLPEFVDEETYKKYMDEINESDLEEDSEKQTTDEIKTEKGEGAEISQDNDEEDKEEDKEVDKEKKVDSNDKTATSSKDQEVSEENESDKKSEVNEANDNNDKKEDVSTTEKLIPWTYEESKYLFELCDAFELKWHIIYDRFNFDTDRTLEDLKLHFYRLCSKILQAKENSNPAVISALDSYSKGKEIERKQYLESLLKRTPAEIAEEESLVIEARRFELAAKKMLMERSHLLSLLDSPQTSQNVQQYQSSQGVANLYNNLMIMDKHQKKRQALQQQRSSSNNQDPIPPPIPIAAASSFKKERSFQTPLQQHLSGVLKNNQVTNIKQDTTAIQQLLMKRLTVKEEEAYGLHYHPNEKLTLGVVLRSLQRLPGLQQRQSVLKSVNSLLQELDIPTAGGTSWKPVMPTRKTMAKYDELLKSVVTLLEIKKGKDRLESEIKLIRSQIGLQ